MCASSVPADVESDGKEARVSTAPPDTATASFVVAVRTAKGPGTTCCRRHYVRMAGQELRKWLQSKSMNWVSVDSSVFASVAYRSDQRQLFLRFHSGKVYRYFGFPPDQYDELLAAKSKGEYFAESIRGKFLYEEVREAHGSAG